MGSKSGFLSCQFEQELYPGLTVGDRQILDLTKAFTLGQSAWVVDEVIVVTKSPVK